MKALNYLKSKEKRAVWLRAFRIWQRRPYELAPLSEESHECSSCKTVFTGNYCPRCGQPSEVGRFSFKKALLLFLDVWGIGNRSMFRSLRDLMFRPGYMIRDYLRGMQSAYFPPFKMFFLLAALSLVIEHGFDLGLSTEPDQTKKAELVPADSLDQILTEQTAQALEAQPDSLDLDLDEQLEAKAAKKVAKAKEKAAKAKADSKHPRINNKSLEESTMYYAGAKFARIMNNLWKKNPAIFALLTLMMFSLPLYLFLRHSPNIPDMRYSEFAVALVYTSNAYSIYSIIGNLLNSSIIKLFAVLIIFIALKQFSGYSKRRLLGYSTLSILIMIALLAALMGLVIYILYVTSS